MRIAIYARVSTKKSNRDGGGYKVLEAGTVLNSASRSSLSVADREEILRDEQKPLVIDDAFIREWEPKYDLIENDEEEYQRLVVTVARDMVSTGTISQSS